MIKVCNQRTFVTVHWVITGHAQRKGEGGEGDALLVYQFLCYPIGRVLVSLVLM